MRTQGRQAVDDQGLQPAFDATTSSRRPWAATPEQIERDGYWSDYSAWSSWIQQVGEQDAPNGAFYDPSSDDHEVAIGLYVVCCKLADGEYLDPTPELMKAAEELGAGWALGDIARALGATEGKGLTAEEIVDRVIGLRKAVEATLHQLDYLQGLWGREAITDRLAGRLRAAVEVLGPDQMEAQS